MKRNNRNSIVHWITACLVLILAVLMLAGCSSEGDEEENEVILTDGGYIFKIILESDTENDRVWEITQDQELFQVEESFMMDDSYEGEGTGEEEIIVFTPTKKGDTSLHLTYENGDGSVTTYNYDVTVDEEFNLAVNNSSGDVDGVEIGEEDVPKLILDRE